MLFSKSKSLLAFNGTFLISNLQKISHRSYKKPQPPKKKEKVRWKIMQFSTHIMRNEAQRRGEVIRDMLLDGYSVRCEFWEKSVEDPEKPPGDIYKLKDFVVDQFSDVGEIENEKIRKTFGVNLISQMAFDVRLKSGLPIKEGYNAQTMQKLLEWTAKRSDVATMKLDDSDNVTPDIEIHEDEGEDEEIIDYVEEEKENTVGYFKEWNEAKNKQSP